MHPPFIMQLLVASLCDSAVENQGKLNVTGAFDAILAPTFPASFGFTLVLRFCFTAEDHGTHSFSIRLADDSGGESKEPPTESEMKVNMPPGTSGFSTQNMIVPLNGNVQKAGIFHFDVHFDGKVLARVPFRVINQSELNQPPAA